MEIHQLQFPDPERDARKANRITTLIELCLSDNCGFGGKSGDIHNTIYFDSLGRVLHEDYGFKWGFKDYSYNDIGWLASTYEVSDFGDDTRYHYSYVPNEATLFQYRIYGSVYYIEVWKFNTNGNPVTQLHPYSKTVFDYDSLVRLVSTTTTLSKEFAQRHAHLNYPLERHTLYHYQGSTTKLLKQEEIHLDSSSQKMGNSYTIDFDSNGLATEKLYNNGEHFSYQYSDTVVADKRRYY